MAVEAKLLLEDGTLFTGKAFGSHKDVVGEVIFQTAMTGYQETLTNHSTCGQIVVLTYPLIGNCGINRDDFEAVRPTITGLVVREYETVPSNWRASYTLDDYMKENGIPGISGIDTRMLVRKLRRHGSMKGLLTTADVSVEELGRMLADREVPRDQVAQTSTKHIFSVPGPNERIVLIDFGAKNGILRELVQRGCDVVVVPHDTSAKTILNFQPDGVLLSNGPGDPRDIPYAVETIRNLVGKVPIFGICLGHQLFSLACGAHIEKMKFGHHGGNHPVVDLKTGKCSITSQAHLYAVTRDSIANTDLEVTHINNNDKTVEGVRHKRYPAFSVQFHPEALPGPDDSNYLFDEFLQMIRAERQHRPQISRQAHFAAQQRSVL